MACLTYSIEFAAKWVAGFVGWPSPSNPYWLNDRPIARTPWLSEPRFREIDEFRVSEIPESFMCRRLPEECALHYVLDDAVEKSTYVSYISYVAGNRKPTKAADQVPTHLIFKYDDRISAARWAKVIGQSDIEQGMACRLKSDARFRRSFCLKVDAFGGFTAPALARDPENAKDVNCVLYAAPKKSMRGGDDPF